MDIIDHLWRVAWRGRWGVLQDYLRTSLPVRVQRRLEVGQWMLTPPAHPLRIC